MLLNDRVIFSWCEYSMKLDNLELNLTPFTKILKLNINSFKGF